MLFIAQLWKDPHLFFTQLLVVVFSICCHEYAHARAALWQGDRTAADQGHLTLNPLKQMGPASIIMLLFIGIAWGAVPVNPARMRHRWSDALVSFAGPFTNLLLAVAFATSLAFTMAYSGNKEAVKLFMLGSVLNMTLFFINIAPIPPFDGWSVLRYFVPRLNYPETELGKGMMLFSILLLFLFIDYIFTLAKFVTVFYAVLILALLGKPVAI